MRDGRSVRRLLAVYALASLLPVVLLGLLLSVVLRSQAEAAGLDEARGQASITSVALTPLVTEGNLEAGVTPLQRAVLDASVRFAADEGRVFRARVFSPSGRLAYSSDRAEMPAGFTVGEIPAVPNEHVLAAANGEVTAELTRLNGDVHDTQLAGPRAVEVYQPLRPSSASRALGVLELYLPYDPIAERAAAGESTVRRVLVLGLAGLWAVLLGITVSVTRRLRRQMAATDYLAGHDPLTELPNRVAFRRRATATLESAQAHTAIAVFDLDRFKEVNDALGHRNGDALLEQLGARLAAAMRPGDTIARLGGDEFGVVVRDVAGADEAEEVLRRLRSTLADGIVVDGLPLAVEASVGYALAPQDGEDIDALLRSADVAMYAAKRRHLGLNRYDDADNPHDGGALTLIGELQRALDADELVLHYQPKADVQSGEVDSVEALVRWQHPELGLLFPDSFIPAVEQTELIEPLTYWVVEHALRDLDELDPAGRMRVAINVSARSLSRPEFADTLLALLARCGATPERIILEMTETALLVDPDRAAASLRQLADAGIAISIDDFGAGQTSLGYLATLPVHEVKIDKSFVLDMAVNPRNAAIVRSVVELAHSLGFTVTAEGVETQDSLSDLQGMRCDAAQGYLLSRPVPPTQLRQRIAELWGSATLPV
jgi:diguanylate cyclase (GGDEF)-like protein